MIRKKTLSFPLAVLAALSLSAEVERPTDVRVEPMLADFRWGQLKSRWDEGLDCFNRYTPENTYCGCVATAIGMVMRHNRWPEGSVPAIASARCTYRGAEYLPSVEGGPFLWSRMPEDAFEITSQEEADAIGRLVFDIAASSSSDFATNMPGRAGSSLATITFVQNAYWQLKKRYGYASAEGVEFKSVLYPDFEMGYSEEILKRMIIPACDYGSPVTLSVIEIFEEKDAVSGAVRTNLNNHVIVVDGYGYDSSTNFVVHANCGDSALGKWFRPPDFSFSGHSYVNVGGGLYNILPKGTGTLISGRVLDSSKSPVVGATVTFSGAAGRTVSVRSGAKGVYAALIPSAGKWTVSARSEGLESLQKVVIDVEANETNQVGENGEYYSDRVPTVGNQYGQDLVLAAQFPKTVDTPTFSVGTQTITGPIDVTINVTTPDAVIRYTLDGSDPDRSSTLYDGTAISVNNTLTLKVRAFARHMNPSETATAVYTYSDSSVNPAGDLSSKPWIILSVPGQVTVPNYCRYGKDEGDPLIDPVHAHWTWTFSDGSEIPVGEYHSIWFKWTSPGNGRVTFSSQARGGGVLNYDWAENIGVFSEKIYPNYQAFIGVRAGDEWLATDGSQNDAPDKVENRVSFEVEQGKTYDIMCVCPYKLDRNDPVFADSWWYCSGYDGEDWTYDYFDPTMARLELKWSSENMKIDTSRTVLSVTPGKPEGFARKVDALAAAEDATIRAPEGLSDETASAYAGRFSIKTKQTSDGKWVNVAELNPDADFTEQERKLIQEGLDAAAWDRVNISDLAAGRSANVEVSTMPGFYYSVSSGPSVKDLSGGPRSLATGSSMSLDLPSAPGVNSGFYRINAHLGPSDGK